VFDNVQQQSPDPRRRRAGGSDRSLRRLAGVAARALRTVVLERDRPSGAGAFGRGPPGMLAPSSRGPRSGEQRLLALNLEGAARAVAHLRSRAGRGEAAEDPRVPPLRGPWLAARDADAARRRSKREELAFREVARPGGRSDFLPTRARELEPATRPPRCAPPWAAPG